MDDISKYIATVSKSNINDITNNAEIIINNIKILIKTTETELHVTKNNIISIDYNENTTEIKLFYYNNKIAETVYIKFDEQSQSAYDKMTQHLKDFSKVKGVLYYDSGNFRMDGEFILDEESGRYSANGNASVYYDQHDKQLYYEGEIEDEAFDGAGIFYNKTGNISLKVNNISQNNPIGNGTLIIKNHQAENYYEKDFLFDNVSDIDFTNFNLGSFVETNLGKDCIFSDLTKYNEFKIHYNIDVEVANELKTHESMTNDKKYEILYRKIFELESKMDKMMNIINEINTKIPLESKRTGFFSLT
jgi:hypothetical protein